ncbi:hypothetical protein FRC07_007293, partial [Ceratobasidium sp. 392]
PDRTLTVYLGTDKEHEVYEAEVLGLQLGLRLLEIERMVFDDAVIFIDNQAVLRTLQSGQTEQLLHAYADLGSLVGKVLQRHGDVSLGLQWIPGHEGVEGNEKADEEARRAGRGENSDKKDLPKHLRGDIPINPTAAKRLYKKSLLEKWRDEFEETHRKERLVNLDPSFPSLEFFKAAKHLPRRHYATLPPAPIAVYDPRLPSTYLWAARLSMNKGERGTGS